MDYQKELEDLAKGYKELSGNVEKLVKKIADLELLLQERPTVINNTIYTAKKPD